MVLARGSRIQLMISKRGKFIPSFPLATGLVGGTLSYFCSHPLWHLKSNHKGNTARALMIMLSLILVSVLPQAKDFYEHGYMAVDLPLVSLQVTEGDFLFTFHIDNACLYVRGI